MLHKSGVLLTFILLSSSIFSCGMVQMEKNIQEVEIVNEIEEFSENESYSYCGMWDWVESYNDISSEYLSPETEGFSKSIVIDCDLTYYEIRNDKAYQDLPYLIEPRISIYDNSEYNAIIINGWYDQLIVFADDGNTLYLIDNNDIGYTAIFEKYTGKFQKLKSGYKKEVEE